MAANRSGVQWSTVQRLAMRGCELRLSALLYWLFRTLMRG
jgi:hypothetical protein